MFNFDKVAEVLRKEEDEAPKLGSLLVVDDEEENVSALERLLSKKFHVFATTDPQKALELYTENDIDIILSDQRMPILLGTELLEKVRELGDDHLSLILTGYTDPQDLITCINQGLLYRYLVKPWHPKELVSVIEQALDQLKKDRMIRKLIPEQIITRLYEDSNFTDAKAGDAKEVECAILFLDIHGFTPLVESMEPREAFAFLTSFVTRLTPIVHQHNGYVDKYLGDGIMAIFDNPASFREDAIRCAVALQDETKDYNEEHRSGPIPEFRTDGGERSPIRIGVAINIGKVMMGAIGASQRMEFTVLGDAVNVAARIEELTRTFGVKIVCHEDIAAASEGLAVRKLGGVQLRGKTERVTIYDVFENDPADLVDKKKSYQSEFERVIDALLSDIVGEQDSNVDAFKELFKAHPYDPVLRKLHEFIEVRNQQSFGEKPSLSLRSI